MAESIVAGAVSNVIAKLLEYAGKAAVKEIAPYFGGKRRLKKLKKTMVMIQARLFDAERRGEGCNGEAVVKNWLKELKHLLYRLEDFLEEVSMVIAEKEQMPRGKLTEPIRLLFSSSSPLKINKKVAKEAKYILEELTAMTSLMDSLKFRELPPGENRVVTVDSGRETHSFVVKEEVIGRDEDKNEIIRMLLDLDHDGENLSVIPIVGIGGLGKTTLAQLIFTDDDVQKHFELKGWACISDIFSLRELAKKILTSISSDHYGHLTLEQIQDKLRQSLNEKRYLLVLDDIWDEDRKRWLDLRRVLGGKQGSKIIVTSRSKVVAENMGTVKPYELRGLPEDKSWDLFRSLAFKPGQEEGNQNMTSIGKEIVKKCAAVPLAIKTIACLLYSMDTEIEWKAFKDKDLAEIEQDENSILMTLKLSYDRLPSELKRCFAYCSLFPKDHELLKQDLIYLWMAQGFLRSSRGHQSPEDVGHGYFMQLMRRCFFQDVECDTNGEIISCKMHDLVHDLAQLAAGGEALLVVGPTQHINDNILHVSICSEMVETQSWLIASKRMRSFFHLHYSSCPGELISSMRCLRALIMANFKSVPDSLGELKHLRYLKLGGVLRDLPECITRLQNLHTLDLRDCHYLETLPRGFSKLINLRHLHFHPKNQLTDLPDGFGQLTSLRALDKFVVGESNGLDALGTLNHLAGCLFISFENLCGNTLSEAWMGILKEKKLTDLELQWNTGKGGADDDEKMELAMRCLQPPTCLKRLEVGLYKGVRFPSWGMDELPCLLPNLVKIKLFYFTRCQHLPPLGRLPHLRSLHLQLLDAVQYMESDSGNNSEAAASAALAQYNYFPSLESLKLRGFPNLIGWSSSSIINHHPQNVHAQHHPSLLPCSFFPRLLKLEIMDCPKLKSMPLAPSLVSLKATNIHEKLLKHLLQHVPHLSYISSLQSLEITSAGELESLSMNNMCALESLEIQDCQDLDDVTAVSPTPMTSLRKLVIRECGKLRDISGLRQYLAFVEELTVYDCPGVDLGDLMDDDSDGGSHTLKSLCNLHLSNLKALPESIGHLTQLCALYIGSCSELTALPESFGNLSSLKNLEIVGCRNLTALPESFGNLSSLQQLQIRECRSLAALPESFRDLTSLQSLEIQQCPELKRRCEKPDGQNWPLIQHISHVDFSWC